MPDVSIVGVAIQHPESAHTPLMLVLSRRIEQALVIGGTITVSDAKRHGPRG